MTERQRRPASGNERVLWVLMAACVAMSSLAFVAFKAKTGDVLLAVVIWAVVAAVLCIVVRQIWMQLDGFKGKRRDRDNQNAEPQKSQAEANAASSQAAANAGANIVEPRQESPTEKERRIYMECVAAVPQAVKESLPKPLQSRDALFLLVLFREDGYLNERFRPSKVDNDGAINQALYAFLADGISQALMINNKWKTFGDLWGISNGAQSLTNLAKHNKAYGVHDYQKQIAKTLRKATRLRPTLESESLTAFTRKY